MDNEWEYVKIKKGKKIVMKKRKGKFVIVNVEKSPRGWI